MDEASLSRYLTFEVKKLGGLAVKVDASRRGWPDKIIIYKGVVCFVELKSPSGRGVFSKLQLYMLDLLRCHNVNVWVVSSKDEVKEFIKWLKSSTI